MDNINDINLDNMCINCLARNCPGVGEGERCLSDAPIYSEPAIVTRTTSARPSELTLYSTAEKFKKEWTEYYRKISEEETPHVDGTGKKIVDKRPDGYDYIEESHMRNMLDKHFPGWSWEMASTLQFLGAEWVVAQGHLTIIDPYLKTFGINPPIRKFFGVDAVRIQYRTCPNRRNKNHGADCEICHGTGGMPHTPENIVDVGDNCKSASTAALKYAINRLTHIGDDIYGKRTEYAGAGSMNDYLMTNVDASKFGTWLGSKRILISEAMKILGVSSIEDITNYEEAMESIKKAKGIK